MKNENESNVSLLVNFKPNGSLPNWIINFLSNGSYERILKLEKVFI